MSERTLGAGFAIGHYTDSEAQTGCTVILPPAGNVTSCDIRGSSPGERELALLHTDRRLSEIHALLLTGGSAFGLAAADGVVSWLEERGRGYATGAGVVPIVPAAVIFDLGTGRADVRPGPAEGKAACEAATYGEVPAGLVGAGTGATVGKWAGRDAASRGGVGLGRAAARGLEVRALAVANAVGDVIDADGTLLAGTRSSDPRIGPPGPGMADMPADTVLAVVTFAGSLDKRDVRWLAARGSDGITTAVRPAHTRYDGDIVFAIAAPPAHGAPDADLDVLGPLATRAVAAAVRDAVVHT